MKRFKQGTHHAAVFCGSICISICLSLGVTSARGQDPPAAAGEAYFETHVRPLLAQRCYSCHSARANKREGGLVLDGRAGWVEGGDRGPAIVPGDADASLLIQAVRFADPDLQMPPDKALPADAIAHLEHWVRLGAPDPREEDEGVASDVPNVDPSDPEAGRQHWAFLPLANSLAPDVRADGWPRTSIDRFVLARLEAENLRPAPDADRRTLVRRAYLQLLGLPPTMQQVEEFLDDRSPIAFERLVDRLLNSPHFGERWGRHWLDLARYADSNGLDENFLFREAWRYRNWVIDAVNADMPWDVFVEHQIAGDLLPFDSLEQRDWQRIAAGFMVVGPKVLLGNDSRNQRMEVADEQLDTLGRALLGQTLGCARCHDHKFDPVPTADYYALAGILTSTRVMEKRYMLGEQRVMEQLIGLGAEGDALDAAYEKYWRERPGTQAKQAQAKKALDLLEKGGAEAIDAFVMEQAAAFADGAADACVAIEQRVEAQKKLIAELDALIANPPAIPPRAMIPAEMEQPADEYIRVAGQFDRQGEQVARGFLRVLSHQPADVPAGRSGRLELGRWLTDKHGGAGHLAARVMANRVWRYLIGRGIVRTVDNFGRTGEAPSHPELLDHLAGKLIDSGWSVKALAREIVLSRAFAMSSQHNADGEAIDPDNRLFWRAHRRRIDPESTRDALLAAAGQLSLIPLDSSVWYLGDQATAVGGNEVRRRTNFPNRSVYLPVIRNDLPEIFDVFDFADPHATTGMRPETTVPTQGLFLLNDHLVMDAAEAAARRALGDGRGATASIVDRLFELILNAPPTERERGLLVEFIDATQEQLKAEGEGEAKLRAWSLASQALFASSRFQILE